MTMHLWQGKMLTHEELLFKMDNLESSLSKVLSDDFNLDRFIESCDHFSRALKTESDLRSQLLQSLTLDANISTDIAKDTLLSIADFISKRSLRLKLKNELGSQTPFVSRRIHGVGNVFEKWVPLGLIVQILSGNDYALPILSAFEGLMTGNLNILKLSHHSGSFTVDFFKHFCEFPQSCEWGNRISVITIRSSEKSLLNQLYKQADGVVVWGGEETVSEVKKSIPSSARFIEWSHKISFAYLSKAEWTKTDSINNLAHDILFLDQQACSSPQCVYLEDASLKEMKDFSIQLGQSLNELIGDYKSSDCSAMETAEITKIGLIVKAEKSLVPQLTDTLEDESGRWRIWIDTRSGLRASPLFKTIWIKPIERSALLTTFRPMRQYLQTVGLACDISEIAEISQKLYSCGVSRVRAIGSMQDSYVGEPHDGYLALSRYVKKVSLHSNLKTLNSFSNLQDLSKIDLLFSEMPKTLMDKVDFQNTADLASSQLYFKSGGSSGVPKISQFTYLDYHLQMQAAANGLMAAGLDPQKDRSMNLFFGGGLYGGFISFFSVLEQLNAIQFPMSAHMDFDFVGQMICKYKVNVLLGMPSFLMQLLDHNKQIFIQEHVIEKIFYGGEAFSSSQIELLKSEYGIKLIKSASYGSVDMGPLGYQCAFSDEKTYHLHHEIHSLEILKLDSLITAGETEVGRLVFSTHSREDQNLLRYDVGDLGKWVHSDCDCGRKSPRFELHGRYGDIFRAAGTFLNYNQIVRILSESLGLTKEIQIELLKNGSQEKMRITVGIDSNTAVDRMESDFLRSLSIRGLSSLDDVGDSLIKYYPDLSELIIIEKVLTLEFKLCSSASLKRAASSGKLIHVIDRRGEI